MSKRSSSTYRPRRSSAGAFLNAAARLLGRVGVGRVTLDSEPLVAAACRRTGLNDFGGDDWREPLDVLVGSLTHEANLTPIGRMIAHEHVTRLLARRLRLQESRRQTPAIVAETIRAPLFITGLPRSGTSFLHNLLAQDPANRTPLVWEVMRPFPAPEPNGRDTDSRIALAERELRWMGRLVPNLEQIHTLGARRPQECIDIVSHSFLSNVFETMYTVPSYSRMLERCHAGRAYRAHKLFLQHLQSGCPASRWVLKAPAHLLQLPALVETYPDAMIVQTHREPRTVLGSVASLLCALRGAFSDRVDPHGVGVEVSRRWSRALNESARARRSRAIGADRFLDVRFDDLVQNPMGVVHRIYQFFELEMSATAERRIRAFAQRCERENRVRHAYAPEMFGIAADTEIERHQADWHERRLGGCGVDA